MRKEVCTKNVKFPAPRSGWALMVIVNMQYFQYLIIIYYWTKEDQLSRAQTIQCKVLLSV